MGDWGGAGKGALGGAATGAAAGSVAGPWGAAIGGVAGGLIGGIGGYLDGGGSAPKQDPNLLAGGGQQAAFGQTAANNYNAYQQAANRQAGTLQALQSGQNSVSAEQLRQGLQQNMANQMSMANSAQPGNAEMAARSAMMNAGTMGAGLAGQQAVAGLAERNQATMALNGLLGQQGSLGMQGALGGQSNSNQAFGAGVNAQQAALNAQNQQNLNQQNQLAGMLAGAGSAYATGQRQGGQPAPSGGYSYGDVNTATSDRRLKKNIKDGSKASDDMIAGLRAHLYDYKSEKSGPKGTHLGPMAQDLERIGSRSVINTAGGKVVHGARLALELAATTGRLGERLAKLEAAKGK